VHIVRGQCTSKPRWRCRGLCNSCVSLHLGQSPPPSCRPTTDVPRHMTFPAEASSHLPSLPTDPESLHPSIWHSSQRDMTVNISVMASPTRRLPSHLKNMLLYPPRTPVPPKFATTLSPSPSSGSSPPFRQQRHPSTLPTLGKSLPEILHGDNELLDGRQAGLTG